MYWAGSVGAGPGFAATKPAAATATTIDLEETILMLLLEDKEYTSK